MINCQRQGLIIGKTYNFSCTVPCTTCQCVINYTGDIIYDGHCTVDDVQYGHYFRFIKKRYCPNCGMIMKGSLEPCDDNSIGSLAEQLFSNIEVLNV